MIPNWLLGKSKSKLQEILGGGGGGGTSYTAGDGIDISDGVISFDPATTPAIDPSKINGLDDDLAALAPKTALSNPNILHNPWFSVNQRGFTTDTGSAKWWVSDRWYIIGDDKTVTRASDGALTIKNEANTNIYLVQKAATNKMASLIGKKVTASIMFGDGTIKSGTITFNANERQSYLMESNFELYKNNSSDGNSLLTFTMPAGELIIKALKLEVGEISTLHLDSRPEYATELAKCQRYFQRITQATAGATLWMATYRNSNTLRTVLPLAAPMIAEPSVTVNGTVGDYTNGGLTMSKAGPSLTNGGVFCIIFNISKSGVTWSDGVSKLISPDSADFYIDFSAEL